MIAQTLVDTFRFELSQKGLRSTGVRMSRLAVRLPTHLSELRELIATRSVQAHHRFLNAKDPFFVHAHRDYLCTTLSSSERIAAALFHYRFVDQAFDIESLNELSHSGLSLWRHMHEGNSFDIRLMFGNDNMYEGGLSLVFFVNNQRVGLMSLSLVDAASMDFGTGPMMLLTRHQMTSDRWYQQDLQNAFGHIALPYLLLGSLTGAAQALNLGSIAAVLEHAHPAARNGNTELMKASYSSFWGKYGAVLVRDGIVSVQLPLPRTPLNDVNPKHRRRAKARRAVMEAIADATHHALAACIQTPRPKQDAQFPRPVVSTNRNLNRGPRIASFFRTEYEHLFCMAALRSTEFAGRSVSFI